MMWSEMVGELSEPMRHPNWLIKVLLGGLLNMIPVLNLIADGYIMRRIGLVVEGVEELPEWENFWDLFVMGVKYTIVFVFYLIIPLAVMGLSGVLGGVLAVVGMVLIIPFAFFLPMALVRLAITHTLSSALDFSDIVERIKLAFYDYTRLFAFTILIFGMLSLVGGVLSLTILLYPFVAILSFYIMLVLAKLYATLYVEIERGVVE